MKAVIWTKYGSPDGLQIQEVEKPSPKDDEILIKVYAVSVATPDTEFRKLSLPFYYALPVRIYLGLMKPTRINILGTEFAGEVEFVGKDVTKYKVGDQVYGYTGLRMGTYAEYICLPEKTSALTNVVAHRPTNIKYEEAASLPFGGLEALHTIRRANLQRGEKILIVGAGGSIGSYSIQFAKLYGAEVTGVDKTSKLELMRSLGADHVIDFTQEDFTKHNQKYDVIVDTIDKSPFWGSLESLSDKGRYINAKPGLLGNIKLLFANIGNKKIMKWSDGYTTKNLLELKELVEAGIIKPVIDRVYELEQIVEAHKYVDSGEKKGNVVVRV